jgi:hypothetical protein
MKSLFDSLLRLYEFDGPAVAAPKVVAKDSVEGRELELPTKDASTFPYLP